MKRKISEKQAAASRSNGKLSCGPVTAQGKAHSSLNAFKLGFFTHSALLPGESAEEYAAFRGQLFASFAPTDGEETMLVERLADSAWRLRRFPILEATMFSSEYLEEQADRARRKAEALTNHRLALDAADATDPEACRQWLGAEAELREELNAPQYALGRAFKRDIQTRAGFAHLSRCEALLERGFFRCLHQLHLRRYMKSQNEPGNPLSSKDQPLPGDKIQ